MKRILFDVPRWHLFLHRHARGMKPAHDLDPARQAFEDEVFDRLYAGDPERLSGEGMEHVDHAWASRLHEACDALPDYQRLAMETRGDPDAAALAVEAIMEQLQPELEKAEEDEQRSRAIRNAIRSGCSKASAAVDELREARQGMENVGFGGSGHGGVTGNPEAGDGGSAMKLAQRLRNDERLRKIAILAGRFQRIARRKEKSRVRHGADELTDIGLGAELSRLLPSELVRLKHPKLRRAMLRDLLERKCLQYQLVGTESLGKGPLIVCLDKSGSMYGDADIWATAVALALLDCAQRSNRKFGLICFTERIVYETVVSPGGLLPSEALFVGANGGTDIGVCLDRGMDLVAENEAGLNKADLVLVTDGISELDHAPSIRRRASSLGVTILGVGIGVERGSLSPWCDQIETVGDDDVDRLDDRTATALFAA